MKTIIALFAVLFSTSLLAQVDQPFIRDQPGYVVCQRIDNNQNDPNPKRILWECTTGMKEYIPVVQENGTVERWKNSTHVFCSYNEIYCYSKDSNTMSGKLNNKPPRRVEANIPLGYEFIGYSDTHAIVINTWHHDNEETQRAISAWRLWEGVENF